MRIVEALKCEHLILVKTRWQRIPSWWRIRKSCWWNFWFFAWPEVSFAVSQRTRFTQNPSRSHAVTLERIRLYLEGTMEERLVLGPNKTLDIECVFDADFPGIWPQEDKQDLSCVKSRTSFVICMANCPVIWKIFHLSGIVNFKLTSQHHRRKQNTIPWLWQLKRYYLWKVW